MVGGWIDQTTELPTGQDQIVELSLDGLSEFVRGSAEAVHTLTCQRRVTSEGARLGGPFVGLHEETQNV
jgi:hypothetical protein